jgi:hypothetical protein
MKLGSHPSLAITVWACWVGRLACMLQVGRRVLTVAFHVAVIDGADGSFWHACASRTDPLAAN